MGIRILVDEDTQARPLIEMLRAAGHDVNTAAEAGMAAQDDAGVLAYAHRDYRAVLTKNADDFRELHKSGIEHSGVLAVYRGPNQRKNMGYRDIVLAVNNIEAAGLDLTGLFLSLNAWK